MFKTLRKYYGDWVDRRVGKSLLQAIQEDDVLQISKLFNKIGDQDVRNELAKQLGGQLRTSSLLSLLQGENMTFIRTVDVNLVACGAVAQHRLDNLVYLVIDSASYIWMGIDFNRIACVAASMNKKDVLDLLYWRGIRLDKPIDINDAAWYALNSGRLEALQYIVEEIPKNGGEFVDLQPLSDFYKRRSQSGPHPPNWIKIGRYFIRAREIQEAIRMERCMSNEPAEDEAMVAKEAEEAVIGVQAAALALVNKFFD